MTPASSVVVCLFGDVREHTEKTKLALSDLEMNQITDLDCVTSFTEEDNCDSRTNSSTPTSGTPISPPIFYTYSLLHT